MRRLQRAGVLAEPAAETTISDPYRGAARRIRCGGLKRARHPGRTAAAGPGIGPARQAEKSVTGPAERSGDDIHGAPVQAPKVTEVRGRTEGCPAGAKCPRLHAETPPVRGPAAAGGTRYWRQTAHQGRSARANWAGLVAGAHKLHRAAVGRSTMRMESACWIRGQYLSGWTAERRGRVGSPPRTFIQPVGELSVIAGSRRSPNQHVEQDG